MIPFKKILFTQTAPVYMSWKWPNPLNITPIEKFPSGINFINNVDGKVITFENNLLTAINSITEVYNLQT